MWKNQKKCKKRSNKKMIIIQLFFLIDIFKLSSILIMNKDKISTLNELLTYAVFQTKDLDIRNERRIHGSLCEYLSFIYSFFSIVYNI